MFLDLLLRDTLVPVSRKSNYEIIVANMPDNFNKFVCYMSIEVHFLHSHLDYFLGEVKIKLKDMKEEDTRRMERQHDSRLLLDVRDDPQRVPNQISSKRSFNIIMIYKHKEK